ncbi:MAG: spore coat protein CotJB [Eubacteriaceae bacterium]|nr:spore coat protein CotJB [Eubacteriaceae bacterium]
MLGNDQYQALTRICQYRFAVLETALYLDTHPNDPNVLMRHNELSDELAEAIADYNERYNDPLTLYDKAEGSWTYIERWPFGNNNCNCGGDD